GSHTAKFLAEAECKVVAVGDVTGGFYRADGLDLPGMFRHAREHRGLLEDYTAAERITNAALLELELDLLIPAALGGVITEENAPRIKASLIVEAANAPVEPKADEILDEHGVIVLPDILANAGGVTASYFEWVQNQQHYQWGINRVR